MKSPKLKMPLVTIIVVTYNSAKYVLETLESVLNQSYQNIELIITDDGSTDDTITICSDWLEKNRSRFIRTELINSLKNTGIAPNANRGLNAARGEWVKFIAGDDILFPSTIENFYEFVVQNKHIKNLYFIFGGCAFILNGKLDNNIQIPSQNFQNKSAHEQYLSLITDGNNIHGPTMFFNLQKMKELNGFDESIPFSEDWPIYIKATKNNCKLFFINKIIAGYRLHESGLFSKSKIGLAYDDRLKTNINLVRKKYIIPNLIHERFYCVAFHNWILYKKDSQKNKLLRLFFKSLLIVSPVYYRNKLLY